MCHCPKRVNDVTLSVGNINSMIYSVCSGKPCDCRSDLSCQVHIQYTINRVHCCPLQYQFDGFNVARNSLIILPFFLVYY